MPDRTPPPARAALWYRVNAAIRHEIRHAQFPANTLLALVATEATDAALAVLPEAADQAAADPVASTAPLAAGLPHVRGCCPACGTAGLFLGDGGYVTCSLTDCPEPDAASTLLERRAAAQQAPVRSTQRCGCTSEDALEHQFGVDDCTCVPFTCQTDPPRYCQPGDTVDMISGWERGTDCPHHGITADEAGLRERIAEALYAHDHPVRFVPLNETGMGPVYRESADAVLAVLPAPADRVSGVDRLQARILELEAELATVKDLLRTENKRANDAIDREETAEQAALEAQQNRAAVLLEAADAVAAHPGPCPWLPALPKGEGDGFWWDVRDRDAVEALLRRMADEAQQDPTVREPQ